MSDHKTKDMTRYEAQKFAEKMKGVAQGALRAAIEEQKVSERLARYLMVIVASNGKPIVIPMPLLDELPEDAKLVESYSEEHKCVVLQTARPAATPPLLVDQDGEPTSTANPEGAPIIVAP